MANIVFPENHQVLSVFEIAEMDRTAVLKELEALDREMEVSKAQGNSYSAELVKTRKQNAKVSSEITRMEHRLYELDGLIESVWEKKCLWKNKFTDQIEEEQANRELIEASIEFTEAKNDKMAVECHDMKVVIDKFEKIAENLENNISMLMDDDTGKRN